MIQQQCSFKTMQNNPDDNGTSYPVWDFSKSKFIRKGKSMHVIHYFLNIELSHPHGDGHMGMR